MKGFVLLSGHSSGYYLSRINEDPFLKPDRIIKFIEHVYPGLKDVCKYNDDKKCLESNNANYHFNIDNDGMLKIWKRNERR
jgi:hypothetical protein